MSEEIKFVYFLDGEQVDRESINWESNSTIKVIKEIVYITSESNN